MMSEAALEGQTAPSAVAGNLDYESFEEGFYRVYDKEFALLLRPEVSDLCGMCNQLTSLYQDRPEEISLNSGGVYRFIMECTRCEDLLDQVHAEQQPDWVYIRKLVAITKHSCSISATLQYLTVISERLANSVEGNFAMATQFVLRHFYHILLESARNLLRETLRLGVIEQKESLPLNYQKYFVNDIKSLLRLRTSGSFRSGQKDAGSPGVKDSSNSSAARTQETILYLVSTLLHHCNVIEYLGQLQSVSTSKRKETISGELHEESLAAQRELFHSIITLFDTQCSQKQLVADSELQDLIDHVKVVYQLLNGFSSLMRIEERHYQFFLDRHIQFVLNEDQIQGIIFDFFVTYIDRFRLQVEKIAKCLIQKYSVQKKINLPIPCYRGFHVRPSTLVARIVMHYGSKVNMLLRGSVYNAAVPLDLFRANEVINAEKRREIGGIVGESKKCQEYSRQLRKSPEQDQILMQKYFLELFHSLQKEEKIVVYEVLSMNSLERPSRGEAFLEYIKRQVAYLMATGKIDISSDLMVSFEGDSRVLADIAILAEHGYGEDKLGNNIALPKELSYLRR